MDRDALTTFTLTERVAAECHLSSDDVAFLLAEHRTHVELLPTRRRHHYRLTPAGYVGTIVAPHCRLLIRPKIPVENLFYLLDPSIPVPLTEDRTTPVRGADVHDFLALRLAQLLEERAAAGLHRGYAERAAAGSFVQGRLDLAAQARQSPGRKDVVHCRYEDFTADVPCNQLPVATAELVLRSPLLGDDARTALRHALLGFVGVSPVSLGPDSFAALTPDRLTEAYRPLLDLCRLLADGLNPGTAAGATVCPAFLIDMERVFERYVTSGLVRALPPGGRCTVSVQPLHRAGESVAGQPDLHLRPDVTLDRDGRPVLVLDVKWKRLRRTALVTEDVYQVLAYCTALEVRRGVLVYPGRCDRLWRYRRANARVCLDVRTLRMVGSRESCSESLRRLAARLQRRDEC